MNRRRNVCVMERSVLVFGAALIVFFLAAFLISDRIEASSMTSDQQSYKYYTSIQVKQGESLWSIAGHYMSSDYSDLDAYIEEVRDLNHLDSDDIHAGEYLLIPYYSSEYL